EDYYLLQTPNLSFTAFDHTIRISPEENFTGTRTSKIIASNLLGTLETNFFNITISDSINESIFLPTTNISANITTKQYKAIIHRPVKWIKTIDIENITEIEKFTIELPKDSENISIKTGEEIQQALSELEEYEDTIENSDREDLLSGTITGNVVRDIRNSKGLITRLFKWLSSFTITGNVIQEDELQEEITETSDSKIIDIKSIASQTQETEIAVEYYTQAPTSTEQNISNGKRITISGPDELNYTNILAYTSIDKKVPLNSAKLKLYWYADYEDAVALGYINETKKKKLKKLRKKNNLLLILKNLKKIFLKNNKKQQSKFLKQTTTQSMKQSQKQTKHRKQTAQLKK
ncbi:MAG: hypothetical protein KKF39_02670, partial [Nanoarchaeota archaeon]|nr:hypothetical protein [Nanoarchaeota archaeon]